MNTKTPVLTGLIGHPVSHSKSPLIHGHWIKQYGLSGSYRAIDTPPESLQQTVHELRQGGYAGFNVTIPHKESVMDLCDALDETARATGAVNTVVVKNGALHGMNTDGFGFVQNIKSSAPHFDCAAGPAVVIGAGGAARAIVHALIDQNVPEIRICNRSQGRAEALAAGMKSARAMPWGERAAALAGCNMVVNTTSLGMDGYPPLDLALDALPPSALVCDIVYAPLMTGLLQSAAARGNPVVTGIGMLLHQARPAFQAWFGVMPDVDDELLALVRS